MYDELVKRLREAEEMLKVAQFKEAANLIEQAADAIEELCDLCISQSKDCSEAVAKYIELWEKQPRWIPVTDRLPFAESGGVSEKVLVTDGQDIAIAELFNFEMCEPYWSYTGIGDITHWMSRPQLPKEE